MPILCWTTPKIFECVGCAAKAVGALHSMPLNPFHFTTAAPAGWLAGYREGDAKAVYACSEGCAKQATQEGRA